MLKTGSPAPDIALEDTDGNAIRLSGHQGAVLIYFMRSASCPVCNRHVQDLIRSRDDLTGTTILIALPTDRREAAAWKTKRQIPFPVVVGRQGTPHEMVGLTRKVFGSMQQSGSVLIDAEGIVRHAHGATMPTGGYDKRAIITAARALKAHA